MNYVLSHSTPTSIARRSGLLSIVLAVHAGLLSLVLVAKTVVPVLLEAPLMVRFIDPPKPVEVMAAPQPLPAVPQKREITRPRPTAAPSRKTPTPPDTSPLETTASNEPASASAPVVAAPPPSTDTSASLPGGATGSSPSTGGGEVVGARYDADYLKNPAPMYPPQSRRIGEEGKVILRVLVTVEGGAQQVEIKTSSGSGRLDESAQRTVRRWKFIPARRGGVAVESWVLVPILFKLEQ